MENVHRQTPRSSARSDQAPMTITVVHPSTHAPPPLQPGRSRKTMGRTQAVQSYPDVPTPPGAAGHLPWKSALPMVVTTLAPVSTQPGSDDISNYQPACNGQCTENYRPVNGAALSPSRNDSSSELSSSRFSLETRGLGCTLIGPVRLLPIPCPGISLRAES